MIDIETEHVVTKMIRIEYPDTGGQTFVADLSGTEAARAAGMGARFKVIHEVVCVDCNRVIDGESHSAGDCYEARMDR